MNRPIGLNNDEMIDNSIVIYNHACIYMVCRMGLLTPTGTIKPPSLLGGLHHHKELVKSYFGRQCCHAGLLCSYYKLYVVSYKSSEAHVPRLVLEHIIGWPITVLDCNKQQLLLCMQVCCSTGPKHLLG